MVAKNLIDSLLAMSVEDRLDAYQQLRESLLNDPAIDVVTDEEREVISKRIAEATPDDFSPWEEVDARLTALLKDRP